MKIAWIPLGGRLGQLSAICLGAAVLAAGPPQVGDAAPAFVLQGSDGKTRQLADFKGKQALVLAWFPKAFTPGCTMECRSLRESREALKKFDAAYFPVSVDDVETNRKFAESLELDVPILCDPTAAAAKAYGVYREDGGVAQRWTFYIGKDGRILAVDKEVKPGAHGADIAARLAQLGVAARP